MTDTAIEITADLVRDLLQEQHPDLAGLAIREVAGGWGNQMWRLGDELAVRMQRMDPTPELQLKERRWLPVLAPRLPLPVPTPVRFGEPSQRFPKHWTVMTWVDGEPLDHGSISRGDHAADTLAGLLPAPPVAGPPAAAIAPHWRASSRPSMWRRPPRRRSPPTAAPIPGTARTASRTSSRPLVPTTSLPT